MDVQVGDILEMKKAHPCGSKKFSVLRIGMDFKIKCMECGHEIMLPRSKAEKNIRKIIRPESGH
ncbi:MAG: DUF951 domain-containing protein [Acutalibacteraceae bacterium]